MSRHKNGNLSLLSHYYPNNCRKEYGILAPKLHLTIRKDRQTLGLCGCGSEVAVDQKWLWIVILNVDRDRVLYGGLVRDRLTYLVKTGCLWKRLALKFDWIPKRLTV